MPLCASGCGRECKHRFCSRKCAALYGAVQSRKGKTTDIELKVEDFLKTENIAYEKDKPVGRVAVPDFILDKILIFADGDRWHNTKKAQVRDKKISARLEKQGYTVLRFSGSTILKDFKSVAATIKNTYEYNIRRV